jgi:hypothetical protein
MNDSPPTSLNSTSYCLEHIRRSYIVWWVGADAHSSAGFDTEREERCLSADIGMAS